MFAPRGVVQELSDIESISLDPAHTPLRVILSEWFVCVSGRQVSPQDCRMPLPRTVLVPCMGPSLAPWSQAVNFEAVLVSAQVSVIFLGFGGGGCKALSSTLLKCHHSIAQLLIANSNLLLYPVSTLAIGFLLSPAHHVPIPRGTIGTPPPGRGMGFLLGTQSAVFRGQGCSSMLL